MNSPHPALVSQQAVQRLPRLALVLFCAAYLLPGLFGRDPWKSADQTAFGYMVAMAHGRTDWLNPLVGGLPVDTAVLPHWLGAVSIALLGPWLGDPVAARVPFAVLLALTLALTWYATFHLARRAAAQPLPFAFGGEAEPVDYARTIADGALLALIASLGLLQLGHETTPELAQLFSAALFLWGVSAGPHRGRRARATILGALPLLAASGAPGVAVAAGITVGAACAVSVEDDQRPLWTWCAAGAALAALAGVIFATWSLRWGLVPEWSVARRVLRLLLWFLWPVWVLSLWTLWRWRRQLRHAHLAVPLAAAAVAVSASVAMGGSDRALMLALPAAAALAAFALPTLRRSTSAAIDWFSVFFFTGAALFAWVMYLAMQTGFPARPAANIAKLAPGFQARFSLIELLAAAAGTVAWLWLVRWRTGRHRHALWKSLVLPAAGVALCWLLVMTLWLDVIDYDRSYRPWVQRVQRHVPADECIGAVDIGRAQLAALEYFGRYRVVATPDDATRACPVLLLPGEAAAPAGWRPVARERRPTERQEWTTLYRRR